MITNSTLSSKRCTTTHNSAYDYTLTLKSLRAALTGKSLRFFWSNRRCVHQIAIAPTVENKAEPKPPAPRPLVIPHQTTVPWEDVLRICANAASSPKYQSGQLVTNPWEARENCYRPLSELLLAFGSCKNSAMLSTCLILTAWAYRPLK